jgi:hypothetical protein
MKIISDERGSISWGLFMFLAIIAFSGIVFAIMGPVMDGAYHGFDSDYRTEHIPSEAEETGDRLYSMFGYMIIIPLIMGVIYVIVQSIRSQDGET